MEWIALCFMVAYVFGKLIDAMKESERLSHERVAASYRGSQEEEEKEPMEEIP